MATYIKGHKNYYPDIKPFTPDYKFLSATIDGRQAIYDSNWQATNNLYNRVVYSDLTNPNSIEYQRQFADKLAPELEKISGLDLSLEQNAQSARSVFAPFFEDDTVVYDMVWTNRYKDAMKKYNQIADSPDLDVRGQVDPNVTLQKLAIDRRKFMEADRDSMLNQPLPELIMDADLVKNAQKYLSELDPSLTISQQVPNLIDTGKKDKQGNPILKEDNRFIITQTNGSLVEGAAYENIMEALYNDPRVVKYYNAKSYIQADTTANNFVETGMAQSYDQGLGMWAEEQIGRLNDLNTEMIGEAEYQARLARQVNVNWTNYASSKGIVPGSYDEELASNSVGNADQTLAIYERFINQKKLSETPDQDISGLYNKAASMLAQYNMSADMRKAAFLYSKRGFKTEVKNNDYTLSKYKDELNANSQRRAHRLKMIQQQDKFNKEKALKEIENPVGSLANILSNVKTEDNANNFFIDKDGRLVNKLTTDLEDELVSQGLNVLEKDALEIFPSLFSADQIVDFPFKTDKEGIYKVPLVANPDADNPDHWVVGNQDKIMRKLSSTKKDDDGQSTGKYEFADGIENVFGQFAAFYKETDKIYANDPDEIDGDLFSTNYLKLFSANKKGVPGGLAVRWNQHNNSVEKMELDRTDKVNIVGQGLDNAKSSFTETTNYNIAALKEAGYADPLGSDGNFLTRDDYYEKILALVQNGTIDAAERVELRGLFNNNNLIKAIDSRVKSTVGSSMVGGGYGAITVNMTDSSDAKRDNKGRELDLAAIRKRANKIYTAYQDGVNELISNSPSDTYYNNSAGLSGQPGRNLETIPVYNMNTNFVADTKQEDRFVGLAITQTSNPGKNAGFIGTTIGRMDNDEVQDIINGELDIKSDKSRAAKFVYDLMLTQRESDGDKNKVTSNIAFFPTWGATQIGDDAKEPYAAYQYSKFNLSFSNAVKKAAATNTDISSSDVIDVLDKGFTFVFPRDQTISTNEMSYNNSVESSIVKSLINNSSTNNGIYQVPIQYPSSFRPYDDGSPRGTGEFYLYKDANNKYYYQGELYKYESDTERFPQGFSITPFPKASIDSDPDLFYDKLMMTLKQQHKINVQLKRNAQNISKNNQ